MRSITDRLQTEMPDMILDLVKYNIQRTLDSGSSPE
jgi:hypothetical protein